MKCAKSAQEIKRGDRVTEIDGAWGLDVNGKVFAATVSDVTKGTTVTEPIAFFEQGGFWRISRLVRLAPERQG
jgi:hypothetical protein